MLPESTNHQLPAIVERFKVGNVEITRVPENQNQEGGRFVVVYDDGNQLIKDTENTLAVLTLVQIIKAEFVKYEIPQYATGHPYGNLAQIICQEYGRLRFSDISKVFYDVSCGRIDGELSNYGKPLTPQQVLKFIKVYYDRYMRWLRTNRRLQDQRDKEAGHMPVPAPPRQMTNYEQRILEGFSVKELNRKDARRKKLAVPAGAMGSINELMEGAPEEIVERYKEINK